MNRLEIALDKLVINPAINPRHASDDDVSDLVAQIRANGFTDPLWVRPAPDGSGCFEVIDGSRRLRAAHQVADELNLTTLPVDVMEADDARARELALAANVARAALSPADEAKAFSALKLGGMAEAEIAAHFAVPLRRVQQRIALGQLPEVILDALRAGSIDLDTARAFTLSPSREAQIKAFGDGRNLSAWRVRAALTASTVDADDARARFVGLDAYRAAGGGVSEDLFSNEAYLDNEALLQRLFDDKLTATVAALKDEGWSFVKVLTGKTYYEALNYEAVKPKGKRALTAEEEAEIAALEAELRAAADAYDTIEAAIEARDDFASEAKEAEMERLADVISNAQDRLDALRATPWTAKQMASLGVLIRVPPTWPGRGRVEVLRGRKAAAKSKTKAVPNDDRDDDRDDDGGDDEGRGDEGDGDKAAAAAPARPAGFSEAVEQLLVDAATDALKLAMVRDKPALAARLGLAARVQHWLRQNLDGYHSEPPFATTSDWRRPREGGAAFAQVKAAALARFGAAPEFADILAVLETLSAPEIIGLEAALAADQLSFTALRNPDVRTLITVLDPAMGAEGFAVDEAFLQRLSREQIALITAEIAPAAPVPKGKKPDMIAAALPLISASGWLPEQLRTPSYAGPGSAAWEAKVADSGATADEADDAEEPF